MMTMNEQEQALKTLRSRVYKKYYRWCRALGWSDRDARDWIQEVAGEGLAWSWARSEEWDETRGSFLQWSTMKTCLLAYRELEKAARTRLESTSLELVKEVATEPEYRDSLAGYLLRDELKGLLEALSPDQKLAFAYYYVGDFEVSDISRALGCQPKTVYTLLDRGRKRAREVYRRLRADASVAKPNVVPLTYPRPRKKDPAKTDEDEEPPPTFPEYRQGFASNRPLWSG